VTESDEYKGKTKIKVAWLFPRRKANDNPSRSAAEFFGGPKSATATAPSGRSTEITNDDIPF
jgi:hypothetical protein